MGFLCVGEPSWRLIPHWCLLCELMESVVFISFVARSRKRRPGVSLVFGLVEPVRRGSTVGRVCCLVPSPELLFFPCWTVVPLWVVTVILFRALMPLPLAATCRLTESGSGLFLICHALSFSSKKKTPCSRRSSKRRSVHV